MMQHKRNRKITLAVIADIHFGESPSGPHRRCEIADLLLLRTVRRLNQLVKPDVVLVLGDLVDKGGSPTVTERLDRLREILDRLDAPYLAIPGNHDPGTECFYKSFPRPHDVEELAGARFLTFIDTPEPGYNASRSKADIERIQAARSEHTGPIVALQHVCLYPPEQDLAPYNYTNADEIIPALKHAGVTLSVSGHHHKGAEVTHDGAVTFVNAPGLCESPFPFLEITIDGDHVETHRHELKMPESLQLIDNHVHTELAYCSENMTVGHTISLARDFGLAGLTFAEHSGQLYYDRQPYWRNAWMEGSLEGAEEKFNRMPLYAALKREHEDRFARFGLEVECDARGRLLLKSEDRVNFDLILGTIHCLPGLEQGAPPTEEVKARFLYLVESLCRAQVEILAHPMRIFRRGCVETPPELYAPVADLLAKYGVAAEINFHANEPARDLVRCCLERGVNFSFGSDSHNLYELGDFAYHIALLRSAGFDGDLSDILIGMEP